MPSDLVRRLLTSTQGQAVLEFALVAPILLTVILSGIEFGRYMTMWSVVTQASREGARTAAVSCSRDASCWRGDGSGIVDIAFSRALGAYDLGNVTSSLSGTYNPGDTVRASVSMQITPAVPFIGLMLENGVIVVSCETAMRVE